MFTGEFECQMVVKSNVTHSPKSLYLHLCGNYLHTTYSFVSGCAVN